MEPPYYLQTKNNPLSNSKPQIVWMAQLSSQLIFDYLHSYSEYAPISDSEPYNYRSKL